MWFGWFGFNGGSAAGANFLSQYVVMTTLLAGCSGIFGYLAIERLRDGRASALGLATGAIAGLVGITPSADAVSPLGALAVGTAAGAVVCWAITWKKKWEVDDTLDAFAVHGMGGIVGTLCVVLIGSGSAPGGVTGVLFGGDWSILWRELIAIAATCLYAFIATYAIAWTLNKTMNIRVDEETEHRGLDLSLHKESAYAEVE